jgi:hypothetical protein
MLPIILAAAQAAKDKCKLIQDITRTMRSSQGIFFQGANVPASYAKKYLSQYKQGSGAKERVCLHCWGCNGD